MSDLQSRLAEWADRTVDMYNEIGKVYYNQSPLIGVNESPKILICGINPGSKGDFSELKGKDLLKGNKCWHTHHTWGFWKNLRQFFSFEYSIITDENRFVLTNMSFCATKNANEISKEVLCRSLPSTIELVNILMPKRILLLSGNKAFELIQSVSNELKGMEVINERVKYGLLSGIPTLGIPHPSAIYKGQWRLQVSNAIRELMKEDYTTEEIRKAYGRSRVPFTHQDIFALLKILYNLEPYEVVGKGKTQRYDIDGLLQLTITGVQKGYCGYRLISNSSDRDEISINQYSDILNNKFDWDSNSHWLGIKFFSKFQSKDECMEELLSINQAIKTR